MKYHESIGFLFGWLQIELSIKINSPYFITVFHLTESMLYVFSEVFLIWKREHSLLVLCKFFRSPSKISEKVSKLAMNHEMGKIRKSCYAR